MTDSLFPVSAPEGPPNRLGTCPHGTSFKRDCEDCGRIIATEGPALDAHNDAHADDEHIALLSRAIQWAACSYTGQGDKAFTRAEMDKLEALASALPGLFEASRERDALAQHMTDMEANTVPAMDWEDACSDRDSARVERDEARSRIAALEAELKREKEWGDDRLTRINNAYVELRELRSSHERVVKAIEGLPTTVSANHLWPESVQCISRATVLAALSEKADVSGI